MIWKCADKNIEYGNKVLVMGIVNVTPDSFSDGGENIDPETAAEHALSLERDGADIIDIGGQSTRPGHTPVSESEEWSRIEPVLSALKGKTTASVSVDTFYPYVAEKAVRYGADIINDVSGIVSGSMAQIIRESHAGWIIMHNGHGSPDDVRAFFEKSAQECSEYGIDRAQLCFDMGIGFNKDYDENMRLLANVNKFKIDGYPLLLGVSRKRVVGKGSSQSDPKMRIYGNIAADTAAILNGADIIRVHDVKNEKQGILMANNLKGYVEL